MAQPRLLFKFQFARTVEPTALPGLQPAAVTSPGADVAARWARFSFETTALQHPSLRLPCEHVLRWLLGAPPRDPDDGLADGDADGMSGSIAALLAELEYARDSVSEVCAGRRHSAILWIAVKHCEYADALSTACGAVRVGVGRHALCSRRDTMPCLRPGAQRCRPLGAAGTDSG